MDTINNLTGGGTVLGALTAASWFLYALFKYLAARSERKKMELENGTAAPAPQENAKLGITETQEALAALNAVAIEIIKHRNDGIVKDVTELVEKIVTDSDFKAKLGEAISGLNKVPAELKDLDLAEDLQLGMYEFGQVQEIIKAFN